MRPRQLCLVLMPIGMLFIAGASAHACTQVPLELPRPGATVTDTRPTLQWVGAASESHRVQVAVLYPESRIVASYDAQLTGDSWQLPEPVSVERAAVKVLVTRNCAHLGAQDLHALGPAFFIDMRSTCSLAGWSPVIREDGLQWPAVPGAGAYQVRVYAPPSQGDGAMTLLAEERVAQLRWAWPATLHGARMGHRWAATVWPICDGRLGKAAAVSPP